MTKHPEYKKKLLEEILPPVQKVRDNILEGLDYDTVMDFEYLHWCYNETLRIEPPAGMTFQQTMSEDTMIGKGDKQYMFRKGMEFMLMISEIHHDPVQWRDPSQFIP